MDRYTLNHERCGIDCGARMEMDAGGRYVRASDVRELEAALSELESLRAENEALRAERDDYRHRTRKAETSNWVLKSDLRAERARADALAARVEALRSVLVLVAEGEPGTVQREPCRHCGGGHGEDEDGIEIGFAHEGGCPVLLALNSTPSADLEAHDARIRREEREAAAKKCAEAYWAMVAPKDHAAMHPTIEFWRDALGLEPMSSAEHEALAAIEPRHPEIVLVDDLAMLVRLLVHSIRKHSPDNETARKAMDYLRRHELQGSPLRTTILSPAPDAAKPNNQQEQP